MEAAEEATGYNQLLAEVLAEGGSAGAVKGAPGDSPIQDIPLRLALVGAPFAGKTAMALKLAEEHACKVCSCHIAASAAVTTQHSVPLCLQ